MRITERCAICGKTVSCEVSSMILRLSQHIAVYHPEIYDKARDMKLEMNRLRKEFSALTGISISSSEYFVIPRDKESDK